MSHVTVDVVGPQLQKTRRGNRYLLVAICHTTRYIVAYPLKNLKASNICDKLLHMFSLFSIPSHIYSDNFSAFKSELISAVCEKFGVNLHYSAVWHSQSHRIVERAIRSLEDIIRKFLRDHVDWDIFIDYLLFALREAKHESTSYSAFELIFGRKVSGPLSLQRKSWELGSFAERQLKTTSAAKYMHELTHTLQAIRAVARENDKNAKERMKSNYDKRSTHRRLNVGDSMLLLLPNCNRKLEWSFQGPFKVTEILPNNNYRIFL